MPKLPFVSMLGVASVAFPAAAGFGQIQFKRGDVNGDGQLQVVDAVQILRAVVHRTSVPCPDAADFSDNGLVQLGDSALLLEYLLKGAPDPKPPFLTAGADPSEDSLGCERPEPPLGAEGQARYSLSVQPTVGGKPGFRLRVSLESSADILGGRLILQLPQSWTEDARLLELRPSLELTPLLKEDAFVAAHIGPDRKLRCLWLVSQSDFSAVWPAGARTALVDLTICHGMTPAGGYVLDGEAEAVTPEGSSISTVLEPEPLQLAAGPAECPEPLEDLASMRTYMWLTDAQAEPGETFKVSLYSAASFDVRSFGFRITWDGTKVRAVSALWLRTGFLDGGIENLDPASAPDPYLTVNHTIIPVSSPANPHGFTICHPCGNIQNIVTGAYPRFRNYSLLVEPRAPYLADVEFHHMDVIFQVLPEATAGEAWISFLEKPQTRREDNFAEPFRYVNVTEDELRYITRPQLPARVEILPASGTLKLFTRGDANGDGSVVISDPIATLQRLFNGEAEPFPCDDAADANDDGRLDLSDAVFTLSWLFLGGRLIPAPNFWPGTDPTEDALGCGS